MSEITIGVQIAASVPAPLRGRLLIFVKKGNGHKEVTTDAFHPNATWVAAAEVHDLAPGASIDVDADQSAYPQLFSTLAPLSALEAGHLLRKTPAVNRWLELLTAHFERGDRAAVWSALVEHFKVLGGAPDRESALAFLREVFGVFPDVIASNRGIHFLAWSIWWLPEQFLKHCLRIIEASSWPWKRQAIGEVTALRILLVGPDEYCQSWIDNALANPPSSDSPDLARVGVVFAAISSVANGRSRGW